MGHGSNDHDPLWVFAYGSLMWRPGFDHVERVRGRLTGFRRSFCMTSIHYRGTETDPGLVLALDPDAGAACEGIVYRAADGAAVLEYLRERELISYAYDEVWRDAILEDGRSVSAVAYVMNTSHAQYCGHIPLPAQAEIIARAAGTMGPNRDYLFATNAHLHEIGCPDEELDRLEALVRQKTDA